MSTHRRQLLRYLAASPLFAMPGAKLLAQAITPANPLYRADYDPVISGVDQALSLYDFEAAARRILPPGHWGYLASGNQDDVNVFANRSAIEAWKLRLRRLVDLTGLTAQTELFGETLPSPILLAPIGSQGAFHLDAEVEVARGAARTDQPLILSTMSTRSYAEVSAAYGRPVWFQLYAPGNWPATQAIVDRVRDAGCKTLVFTVDTFGGRDMETSERFAAADLQDCSICHSVDRGSPQFFDSKPNLSGIDYRSAPFLTWEFVSRLKEYSGMNVLVKGIVTAEDAALCVEFGADGVVVSNHGGRVSSSGRGTLECLPEVVAAVDGKIPVLIDGGFRRGDDLFKALALGASAVAIGRPYIWGLAAFGADGVEAVIRMLRAELEMTMRKAGTTSIAAITGEYLTR